VRRTLALVVVLLVQSIAAPARAEVSQQELSEARATMNARAAALQEQTRQLDEILARQAGYETRIARLQEQVALWNREIALSILLAKEQAWEAYVHAGSGATATAVTPEEIVHLGTRSAYLGVVVNTRTDVANRLGVLQADAAALQEELRALVVEQAGLAAEASAISASMQAELTAANDAYQSLYSQWATEEAARQARARAAAAAEAAARLGRYNGPIDATGRMCPVAGATYFRDSWGEPRPGGREHHGTDMMAAAGTPLVAIENGSIWSLSYDPAGGTGLFIRGDSGDIYYYAHLSRYVPGLWAGMRVGVGQYVGYVGQTGAASAPHLHVGWYPGGYHNPITNPYAMLVRACQG
jgi:murein DD-endopeptidase MepM/ murein hydrolase activator NlpD